MGYLRRIAGNLAFKLPGPCFALFGDNNEPRLLSSFDELTRVEFGRFNEDHTQSELKRQLGGGPGGGEGDGGVADVDLVGSLRVGAKWVCKRDDHAEGEEGEIDDGNIEGGRDKDEGRIALEQREAGPEAESKGVGKAKGLGEGEASVDVVGDVNDES
ncbi:hypothetical protein CDL15_Pgr012904 [Punica granatum]|uniref:Uncharacterized protein n=1 Tax=Punica granatum TaxID=22663 RepID=A0A218XER0_PUNGR|nr:hypothetical protein CDL15_Pgr012904 [Punica granatum]PKI79066.1 hypothetical protein CRG98_000547 [Punica granatum]